VKPFRKGLVTWQFAQPKKKRRRPALTDAKAQVKGTYVWCITCRLPAGGSAESDASGSCFSSSII